jgi:hypothetical protein
MLIYAGPGHERKNGCEKPNLANGRTNYPTARVMLMMYIPALSKMDGHGVPPGLQKAVGTPTLNYADEPPVNDMARVNNAAMIRVVGSLPEELALERLILCRRSGGFMLQTTLTRTLRLRFIAGRGVCTNTTILNIDHQTMGKTARLITSDSLMNESFEHISCRKKCLRSQ